MVDILEVVSQNSSYKAFRAAYQDAHTSIPYLGNPLPINKNQHKKSVTLSILIPFGMIGFLTLQFMQDTRNFFALVKAGKFDEAVDYYSHSFVGGSTYGIGHLKYANRYVCGFMLLVGEGSFMATVNQLLASVTCSKDTGNVLFNLKNSQFNLKY